VIFLRAGLKAFIYLTLAASPFLLIAKAAKPAGRQFTAFKKMLGVNAF
jgi:hypothetical protein